MRTSQNGWTVITRDRCTSIQVPGGTIPVRSGDVAVVLRWAVCRWHAEVEQLLWPGCWGWADRPVRGGTSTSNHASGTAVDLSAPKHPLGKRGTCSARQRKAIRRIIADDEGAKPAAKAPASKAASKAPARKGLAAAASKALSAAVKAKDGVLLPLKLALSR